ncbi:MFS drug transporter [Cordyceps fumosorosea ARSEF 2679]|uniref:MFS drug transporter n=1 Tax=Cordyceps fumosorosea (strain ARSEF 2679) TaxID=1081104 RepID=A0A167ZJE5_CORFA|nr:MFS drug transporter [Cordyceps fumosorosea ARSEF 2679]OAA67588.1 MFS drug transporter [Cordyceps fumosorosea ARSEF 2679]
MNQAEPLSQVGDLALDTDEPLQSMTMEEAPTTMEGRSNLRISLVMIALALVLFCSALDTTIVSTVLPTISADLRSAAGYVWVGSAYTLGHAAAATVWANLSGTRGRKPVLLAALVLLFASSLVCATAASMPALIAGRAVQGTAGGGMLQMVNIIIVWTVAGTVGPILGGALTQRLSWRWVFWIDLPLTGAALLVLVPFLDVHDARTPPLAGLRADSPTVVCLLVLGVVAVSLFVYCEARLSRMPLVTRLASPLRSGVLFLPIVISSSLMSGGVGFVIHKTGRYVEITHIGWILVLLETGLFIDFDRSSSLAKIIAYQIILGFGMGMLVFPPLLALHANVTSGQTAAATATFGFVRSMSASVAVVLGGVLSRTG